MPLKSESMHEAQELMLKDLRKRMNDQRNYIFYLDVRKLNPNVEQLYLEGRKKYQKNIKRVNDYSKMKVETDKIIKQLIEEFIYAQIRTQLEKNKITPDDLLIMHDNFVKELKRLKEGD